MTAKTLREQYDQKKSYYTIKKPQQLIEDLYEHEKLNYLLGK